MEALPKKKILNRLARLEGQLKGIRAMVEQDNRECEAIVTQLSAVHAALENTTKMIVVAYLEECLQESEQKGEGRQEALERITALLLQTRL